MVARAIRASLASWFGLCDRRQFVSQAVQASRQLNAEASERAGVRWLRLVQRLYSLRHLQRLFAYAGHYLQAYPKSLRERFKALQATMATSEDIMRQMMQRLENTDARIPIIRRLCFESHAVFAADLRRLLLRRRVFALEIGGVLSVNKHESCVSISWQPIWKCRLTHA